MKNEIFDVEMLRRRFIRPYFIELGLTVGQGQPRILKELREHGAMNQKELSDACLIEVTTMSRTIDRLEKMGLVKRESNPAAVPGRLHSRKKDVRWRIKLLRYLR